MLNTVFGIAVLNTVFATHSSPTVTATQFFPTVFADTVEDSVKCGDIGNACNVAMGGHLMVLVRRLG